MPPNTRCRFLPALFYLLTIFGPRLSFAQAGDSVLDKLVVDWGRYADHHRAPGLFLHLDKSVYEHTENIQFTAYLLGGSMDTANLHCLYVALVNPATGVLETFARFALYRGIGTGALYLADTLNAGEYVVTAYTDDRLNGKGQPLYRQQITLLPDQDPPFALSQKQDSSPLTFRVMTAYKGLAAGGSFRYRLLADGRLVDSGEKKIDAFGEVTLSPGKAVASADNVRLSATVKRQDLTGYFWVPVVTAPTFWKVRYYPEGGDLVDGLSCQLGIGITDNTGNGVAVRGRLLEDGQLVGVFKTDGNGWGRLRIPFHKDKVYTMDFPVGHPPVKGNFPIVKAEEYNLYVQDGVARDSVAVELHFPVAGPQCRLLIYNEQEIAYAATLKPSSRTARTSLPVKDWPTGLLTMTLFDPRGLPVAERKLYVPGPKLLVTIQPDSGSFHTRSEVHLRVKVTDEKGQGVSGLFSFACVQAGRLKQTGGLDIVRYAAIDQHLSAGPFPGAAPFYGLPVTNWDNDTTLNLLLLTRGWTRYHWEEVAGDTGTRPLRSPEPDYGFVLQNGKKLPASLMMVVIGGENAAGLSTFDTDSGGRFQVPPATLLSASTNNLALSISGSGQLEKYKIVLMNEYDSVNHRIAAAWYIPPPIAKEDALPEDRMDDRRPFRLARTLEKVIVTPGRNGYEGCKDYVCQMNVLNCKNHPYGRKPVIGETYRVVNGNVVQNVIYKGCLLTEPVYPPYFSRITPIRLLKEVYETDSSVLQSPVSALYTTLHWSPLLMTDKEGNAEIRFYTNDLPGRYYNIIQGTAGPGVFSGKIPFQVRKEKE